VSKQAFMTCSDLHCKFSIVLVRKQRSDHL